MTLLLPLITQLLEALLPELLNFAWEKAHEPTTVEAAKDDPDLRNRLLAAIRLRGSPSGDSPNHPATPTG